MKVVRTIVKVSQGNEAAGQAPQVYISVWTEVHGTKGRGKGKTDVISKTAALPCAGEVKFEDHGPNGDGTKISWNCRDGTEKQLIAGKEGEHEDFRGFIAETST